MIANVGKYNWSYTLFSITIGTLVYVSDQNKSHMFLQELYTVESNFCKVFCSTMLVWIIKHYAFKDLFLLLFIYLFLPFFVCLLWFYMIYRTKRNSQIKARDEASDIFSPPLIPNWNNDLRKQSRKAHVLWVADLETDFKSKTENL